MSKEQIVARRLMKEITRIGNKRFSAFKGVKTVDQVLPSMPLRIQYSATERDYSVERHRGKTFFRLQNPEQQTPGWEFMFWDVHDIRESFARLRTPEDAWHFLNLFGPFRYRRGGFGDDDALLSWDEIVGWQKLIQKVRLADTSDWFQELSLTDAESKERFFVAEWWSDEPDEFRQEVWQIADTTIEWLQGFAGGGLSIRRDIYLSREEIEAVFASPESRIRGSLAWHRAQENLQRERAKKAKGNEENKQRLIAEITVTNTLDAILATIYVEKLRGADIRLCDLKDCNETFEVESGHGKRYCSNYHAHLASVRRKRAEAKEKKLKRTRKKEKAK